MFLVQKSFVNIKYKIQEREKKAFYFESISVPLHSWTSATIMHSSVTSRRYNLFNGRITYSPILITVTYAIPSILNTQTHPTSNLPPPAPTQTHISKHITYSTRSPHTHTSHPPGTGPRAERERRRGQQSIVRKARGGSGPAADRSSGYHIMPGLNHLVLPIRPRRRPRPHQRDQRRRGASGGEGEVGVRCVGRDGSQLDAHAEGGVVGDLGGFKRRDRSGVPTSNTLIVWLPYLFDCFMDLVFRGD